MSIQSLPNLSLPKSFFFLYNSSYPFYLVTVCIVFPPLYLPGGEYKNPPICNKEFSSKFHTRRQPVELSSNYLPFGRNIDVIKKKYTLGWIQTNIELNASLEADGYQKTASNKVNAYLLMI